MNAEVKCEDCGFSFRMAVGRIRDQEVLSCPQCRSHQLAITWRQAPPPAPEVSPPAAEPYEPLGEVSLDKPEDAPAKLPQIDWDEPATEPPPPSSTHDVIFDDPDDAEIHEVIFDDPADDTRSPSQHDVSAGNAPPSVFEQALALVGPDLLTGLALLAALSLCLVLTALHPVAGAIGLITAAAGAYHLHRRIRKLPAARRLSPLRTPVQRMSKHALTAMCYVTGAACVLLTVLTIWLAVQ